MFFRKLLCALFLFSQIVLAPLNASMAIANWDFVPYQRLSERTKIGVVAFHETGVDVQFSINGESAARITDPTWNDQSGVVEYWIEVNPANYADGPLTLSATAIPDGAGHQSRTLADLELYANSGLTLGSNLVIWVDHVAGSDASGTGTEASPYKTVAKGVQQAGNGGTVYLKASLDYVLRSIGGSNNSYWTTVSAAPGLTANDVHIETYGPGGGTGRYGKNRIRWRHVSLFCDRSSTSWGSIFYSENGHHTWFDEAALFDKNGRWANTSLFNGQGAKYYLTNSHIRDVNNSGGGFQRNVYIQNIGSDVYRGHNNLTAINVTVRNMDKGTTSAHPDFIQFYNPSSTVSNIILYNCKVYDMLAQGIFGGQGAVKDVAFVNLLMEKDPPNSALRSQLSDSWEHILLWNATIVDQLFTFRTSTAITDFHVRNCVFANFTSDNYNHPSIYASSNHTQSLSWDQSAAIGSAPTLGNPMYADESVDDYRLTEASPAWGTGEMCPGVPADVDGIPRDPHAPNRGAFAKNSRGNVPPEKTVVGVSAMEVEGERQFVVLRVPETPGQRYEIEYSTDMKTWTSLGRRFADGTGLLRVETPGGPDHFYRLTPVLYPPVQP